MNKFPIITEFASQEVPKFLEKKNKNIVWFGADNMYPYELIDLYNDSSTHNAIINGKVGYTVGNGLEGGDLETKKWLSQANIDQDWTSLMKSLSLDYEIFNGYAIEVIKTKVGNQYHHIDFANIRVGLDGSIQYADDWITDKGTKNSKPDIQYLERYNPRNPEQKRGVIYHVDYRPNFKYYPLPVYVGSLAEIKTDVQIGDYWLNEVENGFVGGTLIQHNNGVPETKEEAEKFEKAFQEKFGKATGTKIVHLFAPSKDNGSEITSLNGNDLHERYTEMSKRVKESIFIGHRVTNPILFGVKEEGQLGARNELDLAYEIFTNTYIAERQNTLLRTIKKLAFYEIKRTDIEIIPLKPIDVIDLTSDIILANLDREEIRELITDQTGLELKEAIEVKNIPVEPIKTDNPNEEIVEVIDEEKEQKEASYNGAQIASALSIVEQVKAGVLTVSQGKAALMEFLRLSEEVSLKLLKGDDEFLTQIFEKKIQDGKPLFDTIEEAESVAQQIGCEGYHEHEIEGKTWYMPCSTHSEINDKNLEGFNNITKFDTYNDYPKAASRNAQTALNWVEKNGWGSCLEATGKKRANQLAKRDNISRDTIARMAAFERHRKNSKKKLGDGCGRLAWLAWGGDEGIAWAQRKLKQIDAEKMSACSCFSNDEDISHLFDKIGVPEKDYEIIENFNINFDSDGSPIEFATEEQGILQRVLKTILNNPLIAATGISEVLGLNFEELVGAINILNTSDLITIEGSDIGLTDVGERVAKTIDVPETEVKYRYQLRPDAPPLKEGGESRDFCRKMMAKKKLYSKKEIDVLRNGMKPSGADVADVWLARGGWYRRPNTNVSVPYCRHIWKQVIVRKK
jgi:hypothetical protein